MAADKTTRQEPLVLTCEEVAHLLQVSDETVKNLHRTGQLRAVKIGKHARWRLRDVQGFVEGLSNED